MMKVIDVSSNNITSNGTYNSGTQNEYNTANGVIVKATQGVGYVNPYCDYCYQMAKRDNKLRGFYHYAGGNDPIAEARYFRANTVGYERDGIPALDWEKIQNRAFGDVNWCRKFVDEYHRLTGVWCMIYVQASAIAQVANCANDCALWVASYERELSWSVAPWKTYTLWQYTSEPCDINHGNLDAAAWNRIAYSDGKTTVSAPKPVTSDKPSATVYTVRPGDTLSGIAVRYGTTYQQLAAINGISNPNKIYVGQRIKITGTANNIVYYTVRAGDTLSEIATRYNTTYQHLAQINNIADPNKIYIGQRLRIY